MRLAEDLDVLPPIEVNQRNELIDGWHRWTAHKKAEAAEISSIVTETASDAELLELAIERNATHGLQLSQEDKRDMARKIYGMTPERERDEAKKRLARILSVSERTVRDWLSRVDKDSRDARNRRIFAAWMACYTQEEIAEQEDVDQATVKRVIDDFMQNGNLAESHKAAASHAVDFDVPLYNVWKQQNKTAGSSHFGNSEVRFTPSARASRFPRKPRPAPRWRARSYQDAERQNHGCALAARSSRVSCSRYVGRACALTERACSCPLVVAGLGDGSGDLHAEIAATVGEVGEVLDDAVDERRSLWSAALRFLDKLSRNLCRSIGLARPRRRRRRVSRPRRDVEREDDGRRRAGAVASASV